MEALIEELKKEARKSWSGETGERSAQELEAFLRKRIPEYAEAFGLTNEAVLSALERRRNYSVMNYYQESNFPTIKDIRIFETQNDLLKAMPSKRFRCPMCGGVSTDPYECNSGDKMENGKICDWKAYGLFKTLGKGLRFTIREGFFDHAKIDEAFMPLELEEADE